MGRHQGNRQPRQARRSVPYAARILLARAAQKLAASRPEDGETRAKLVGAIEGRIFAPVITRRGGFMRQISARRANTRETRAYGPL